MKNEIFWLRSHFCKQLLATITSSLIPLCTGMTFGITAMMLPKLRQDSSLKHDPRNDSWVVSSASLSMIVGSLIYGMILDAYGRKVAHIIVAIPLILGWILIACSNSTGLIIAGRIITGFSSSAIRVVTMVYIGEITDPRFRSAALYLPSIMAHFGILFSHLAGHYLAWKVSAAVCIIPGVISIIFSLFLNESPLYLIAKGRVDDGIERFRWFRGTSEASEMELKSVLESQANKQKLSVRATLEMACKMSFIKPMLTTMLLMCNTQFAGISVISIYSQDIFERVFSKQVNAFKLTVAMDCIVNAMSLTYCVIGKRVPRKKVLLASNFGASIFLFGLVMSLYFLKSDSYVWVPVTCFVLYICFASGIIVNAWTFVPEVLPNNARGFGSGLTATFAYFIMFIIVQVTPDIMHSFGKLALFVICGTALLILGVILIFILPETTGKTLQSIENSYDKKKDETTSI